MIEATVTSTFYTVSFRLPDDKVFETKYEGDESVVVLSYPTDDATTGW